MTIILTGIFVAIEWIERGSICHTKIGTYLETSGQICHVLCYNTCNIFVWRPGTTILIFSSKVL